MIRTIPLTGQCPRCGAAAVHLAYHSRYTLRDGQSVLVIRCRQGRRTFCDRFGTAFYDLKTPEQQVQRALHQGLEGLCPAAVARIERVHPRTVQRWVERACVQAKAADRKLITNGASAKVELDERYSFAGAQRPDEQADDLAQVGQHWTPCAMERQSRRLLEVVGGPRTQASATALVEGTARRLAKDGWPLWSSDGWEPYVMALTLVYAVLIHFIRRRRRGRPHRKACPTRACAMDKWSNNAWAAVWWRSPDA